MKTLLAAGATVSLLALPAVSAPAHARQIILAQAETDPAIIAAEKAVEDARAALRDAMASGQGIEEAKANLNQALKALDDARAAAGTPAEQAAPAEQAPAEQAPTEQTAPPPAEPPAETPPAQETQPPPPPPAEQAAPPAEQPPAAQPPATEPPAAQQPAAEPPAAENPAPKPPKGERPKGQKGPPANGETPPPPPPPANQAPPADQPPAATEPPPAQPPADQTQAAQPPAAAPPAVALPPPVVEAPPPPPPPAAAVTSDKPIDLNRFKERPKFGAEPTNAPPAAALPKSGDAVKEGATIQAPDGRVIVKDRGQVTILHDDSGRFRQRGDRFDNQRTDNDTDTTTVTRPDGTRIVTVRDKYGSIIQRYRQNKDGSVQVLIGQVEQPGVVGRIFGRGARPAPPPPPRPPALNLHLGPLQLTIPQQEYIVDNSRADERQLQAALAAPPVERVERPYSLEEIRRNGRLRDKVRRIDFDNLTFDTGQATVPDDQIPKLQKIGVAIHDILEQDPTQVFLIEGHTDAVGSDLSNLALSDRRAETVAEILSYYYAVPPENLVTQGYGEQFLKIPTVAAERQNRRVAFRNITDLLRTAQQ
jgi:outer membrane protein OmpA-like peptidoglycan-associated protein